MQKWSMRYGIELSSGAIESSRREHHLDAVRGVLMLLGIPFHATHLFRSNGHSWMVHYIDASRVLTVTMEFLHLFRMQGFFMLAGYFSTMLLTRRSVVEYARSRMTRLLPSSVTALLTLVPAMNWLAESQSAEVGGPSRLGARTSRRVIRDLPVPPSYPRRCVLGGGRLAARNNREVRVPDCWFLSRVAAGLAGREDMSFAPAPV
jgi:hypothetical protein